MGLWEQERQLRHGPQVVCLSSWVEPGPETSVPATYKQSGTADSFLLTAPLSDVFPVSQLLTRNLKKNKIKAAPWSMPGTDEYQIKASWAGKTDACFPEFF